MFPSNRLGGSAFSKGRRAVVKYVLRRLLWVFLSVIAFSFIAFVTLELPPGRFLLPSENVLIIHQSPPEETQVYEDWITDYIERFALDKPFVVRYAAWVRQVVVYGDWGKSMEWQEPVQGLLSERFWLTVLLITSSLFLGWLIALPCGMALACYRGTFLEKLSTLICKINRLIPAFLLALVAMWYAKSYLDQEILGLFSEEYGLAPWSWGRVVDMLGHIWIPILILLLGCAAHSTLAMRQSVIQVMEQDYLDDARARGVNNARLLWHYVFPVAMGKFLEMEADSFARNLSSGTLVAVVLRLQTTGSMMLRALTSQDMYLNTALLFLLGVFCIFGRALLDILRAALAPRVRTMQEACLE